jgi:hypothetical protein
MCAPRVIRHTSIRYSSSCHTRVNMGASLFFTAATIRVNYDEKQLTGGGIELFLYLCRFRKYVSYVFPVTNFCNPGVRYETPCIIMFLLPTLNSEGTVSGRACVNLYSGSGYTFVCMTSDL